MAGVFFGTSGSPVVDSLVTSGPLAVVLGTGLYYVAKAYMTERKERDALQETLTRTIERKEGEKLDAIEAVRSRKDAEIRALDAEVRELMRELIRRLEGGDGSGR